MIRHYYWPTPNGHKTAIMLEEVELEYELHPVNILEGEQFDPSFVAISPNNRIPAIVDTEGPDGEPYAVFESGAILMYLAEKTCKLWPTDMAERYHVLQWLMFQMGNVGPMFGQNGYFQGYCPEDVPLAKERYHNMSEQLYGVLDRRLAETEYLAGAAYSIAIGVWQRPSILRAPPTPSLTWQPTPGPCPASRRCTASTFHSIPM
jgi:GST-like protein